MKKWLMRAALVLGILLVISGASFYVWTRAARYPAFAEAAEAAEGAKTERGWYVFGPDAEPDAGFIFYPGGLVDPAAYSILMGRVSEGGVRVVVVPMPLDLAVFGSGRAGDVIEAYPDIETWIIGGHSLGGAMSVDYVKRHPDDVDGIVLLGSYPADSTDLSGLPVKAVSVYGSEDGVDGAVFEESLRRLPTDTTLELIEGANHAQFGHYGPQKGDGTASMSRDEQQRRTAEAILQLVAEID